VAASRALDLAEAAAVSVLGAPKTVAELLQELAASLASAVQAAQSAEAVLGRELMVAEAQTPVHSPGSSSVR
jgi:hypothetical protein